jgi:hypothetical protein
MLADLSIEFLGRAGIGERCTESRVVVGLSMGMRLTRSVLSSTLATAMSTVRPARSGMSSTNMVPPLWQELIVAIVQTVLTVL